MPIHDVAAQNKSLDNDYGATKGAGAPASHQLCLFYSDPMQASNPATVECDSTNDPGYTRFTISNGALWAAASGGQKSLAAGYVTMASPTGAWLHIPAWWGLLGSDGNWWDVGPLGAPLVISSAGAGPTVAPVIFYSNVVTG